MEEKYEPGKGKKVMIWLRIGYIFFKKAQVGYDLRGNNEDSMMEQPVEKLLAIGFTLFCFHFPCRAHFPKAAQAKQFVTRFHERMVKCGRGKASFRVVVFNVVLQKLIRNGNRSSI